MKAELTQDKKSIVITLPLIKQPSKSGKTTIVATSGGNQPSSIVVDGKVVIVGVNCYVK